MKFEDSLAARLGMMQPSKQHILKFLEGHPPQLSKGGLSVCLSVARVKST